MKNLLLMMLSICTLGLGCDVLSGNKSLQDELLGTWEGMYPESNEGNFTGVEYTFNPDGTYSEAYRKYNSSRKLIGYSRLTLGNYSVEEKVLKVEAREGFFSEDNSLPKTVESLKEEGSAFIIDGFPSGYLIDFGNNSKSLILVQPCDAGSCTIGPLVKK